LVLVLWALRPYRPEIRLEAIAAKVFSDWWVPLRPLTERMDVFSVVGVFTLGLLYLPLGALLAVWPLRLRGPAATFAPAVYVAVMIEIMQVFTATRTLEITHVMIEAAGAAVGWVIVRRAGFRPYGSQLGAG